MNDELEPEYAKGPKATKPNQLKKYIDYAVLGAQAALPVLAAIILVAIFTRVIPISLGTGKPPSEALSLLAGIASGVLIYALWYAIKGLFRYLDTGSLSARANVALGRLNQLETRVIAMATALEEATPKQTTISAEEKSQLLQQIADRIKNDTSDAFIADLESRARRSFSERMRDRTIRSQFSKTIDRLGAEIEALQRRGTTNLIFGILITIAGIVMLIFFLFVTPDTDVSPWAFFAHYAPRLTLVILIEVLAYFFLRLYKSNLDDIKYFQNEITNVEAKHVALQAVFFADDKTLLAEVVSVLSKTERNHILEKGQTTVELERARIDQEQIRAIAKETTSAISSALGGLKRKRE